MGLVNFMEPSRKLLFTHCNDTQSFHVTKTRFTRSVTLCINADELSCFFHATTHFVFQSVFFSRHLSWLHSNKVTNSLYCATRQHIFEHWVQFVSNHIRTAIKWFCGWMNRRGRQWRGPTKSGSLCPFSLCVMSHRQCKSTDGMSDPLFVLCRNRLFQFRSNSDLANNGHVSMYTKNPIIILFLELSDY